MKGFKTALGCLLLLATAASPASAEQILFSNFGPGDSYDTHRATFFGFDEEQTDPRQNFSRAFPFIPAATATLTTVELPLEFPWFSHPWFAGGTLEVNLFASTGGLPAQLLESFSSSATHLPDAISVFHSTIRPQLVAGVLYFLEARAVGETNGLWYLTNGPDGTYIDYRRRGDGPWEIGSRRFEAAFRVSGEPDAAPTPEPATLVLLGSGMAMAAWRRRRSPRSRAAESGN